MLTLQDLYLCDIPLRICMATQRVHFCLPWEKAWEKPAFLAEIAVTIAAEDNDDAWEISQVTIGDQILRRGNTFQWAVNWLLEYRIDEIREHISTQLPEAEAEAERERKYG